MLPMTAVNSWIYAMSIEDLVSYFLFFDPATEFDRLKNRPLPPFHPGHKHVLY